MDCLPFFSLHVLVRDLRRRSRGPGFGLVFRYGTTVFLSLRAGSLIETFWGYTAFPGVSLSVSVFVFAKQVRRERVFSTQRRAKVFSTLAGGSFGVYLMHMVFFWYALLITGMNAGYLFWRTVMPFIVYAACARA